MNDPLAVSLLKDFLYRPRRSALNIVQAWRSANEHKARGEAGVFALADEHPAEIGFRVVHPALHVGHELWFGSENVLIDSVNVLVRAGGRHIIDPGRAAGL